MLKEWKSGETDQEAGQAAPVDRIHLGRYTLGDSVLEREILGLFVAQVPLTLETLKFATNDKDWGVAAHTLKGSGRAIGAWRIAALAQQAEKLGGIGDREACLGIIHEIEEASAEVEAYLARTFPPLSG
ncbi:MAG TPA: Hpt domain-containing protein [Hyphomicrobiaceae bacterium]|nr:Hpt domain-containing protein [Hyphomicrobiaceae bacterium]